MKNDETGEFELVLGNRQLLSGFFIVVILFAVFFVMGYFVGRNTAPPAKVADATTPAAGNTTTDTRPQPTAPTAPPQQTPPPAAERTPAEEPAAETPPARAPQPKPQPPADAPLASGTYLQVMAVRREEAEVVARTLKDKGFSPSFETAPTGLTRVLVGPYTDQASLGKAKADLENAGFHPIVKK